MKEDLDFEDGLGNDIPVTFSCPHCEERYNMKTYIDNATRRLCIELWKEGELIGEAFYPINFSGSDIVKRRADMEKAVGKSNTITGEFFI